MSVSSSSSSSSSLPMSASPSSFSSSLAMSASSSSSSSSFSGISPCVYDVFLSFRGMDTRNNFTSHLLDALNRQGFSTFRDDTKLKSGEDIRSQLPTAILESRLSIVVFSKNYAASGWCLDELVTIMDCRRDLGQIVLPIFYDVSPSDVRRQRGCYAEAFEKHEHRFKGTSSSSSSMERLLRWREALADAANLSGWDLKNVFNGDEAKLIKIVIEEVTNSLDQEYSSVADHPVGIDLRVRKLKSMLKLGSDDVRIVAVWGVGGIGKTTVAKALFNSVRNDFQCNSFLADISETSKTLPGVVVLQKQLLSDILVNETYNLDNYHQGIEVIRRKLCHKKVLLVLDDVDHVQQLKMLGINRGLFCKGSKIIITTRNMSSLMSIQVDAVYSPVELNDAESLKLFSWNAFKIDYPKEGYGEISHEVLTYCEGLPLALEVLGSFLCGRSKIEWQSGLRKLKKHPHGDIQGKLKISFESLDKNDQQLLLDIAFFFIGRNKHFTVKVIEDSDYFPEIGIGELVRRCLVRVDEHNKLRMHNLIRDMARDIVCQESFKEPGERSRLRGHEEVLQVLRNCTGTKSIEGLHLELPELNDEHVNVTAFANMRNLRFLRLDYLCHIRGTDVTISKKLKWLCWRQFPLTCLPAELYMENLVAIDLQYSRLKQLWKGPKRLDKLRFLDLSYSHCLTKTPCFSGLKNLEELLLNDCTNLVKVHDSIGCLDKLVKLNMANCQNLRMIPSSISMLKSLEDLNLSGCSKGPVSMFWKLLTKPQESVPISASSIQGLSCLQRLDLADCNMSYVPSEIGSLTSLRWLILDRNNFRSLPSSLSNLCHLEWLDLEGCCKLRLLSDLPRSLTFLWLDGCNSLEPESVGALLDKVKTVEFSRYHRLHDNNIVRTGAIQLYRGNFVTYSFNLTGFELPDDLHFQGSGSNLSFVVPPHFHQKIKGWIVYVLIDDQPRISGEVPFNHTNVRYEVINKSKGTTTHYPPLEAPSSVSRVVTIVDGTKVVLPSHIVFGSGCLMWVNYVRLSEDEFNNIEEVDEMELVYFCESWSSEGKLWIRIPRRVKKCGIRLIYEDDDEDGRALVRADQAIFHSPEKFYG